MDWVKLFEDNHIEYVTNSPNVKKGNINIRCPWCGEDDPSQHLGISLNGQGYGCWRNAAHRGKNASFLIRAILGCSYSQAQHIENQYSKSDPDVFTMFTINYMVDGSVEEIDHTKKEQAAIPSPLEMPPEFKPILEQGRFFDYLKNRGFDAPYWVARAYNLKCCNTGRWKDRIIIPIYQNGKLVAWTGRALQNPIVAPRYLSTGDAIKTALFNEDRIRKGGKYLFITEGPFDAMKIDYYGYPMYAAATAVFGTSVTMTQISILREVAAKYQKVILLFDADATETTFNMSDWIPEAIIGNLPFDVKDPGELSKSQVQQLVATVRDGY